MTTDSLAIDVKDLKVQFGDHAVINGLNFSVQKGEIIGIVGGSGSGKTTLLRAMLLLQKATAGSISILGDALLNASPAALLSIQRRWGVLFQQNALFSSLTVLENVCFPLLEHTHLDKQTIQQLGLLKILLAGLPIDAAYKYPSELSGGMEKRAALARAIVLDPELLFLDEPTAGLDPNSAEAFDELILNLQSTMGLTVIIVTHDLDTLWKVTNRVAFLGEGKVLCIDSMQQLVKNPHPAIQKFFGGARGRTITGSNNGN